MANFIRNYVMRPQDTPVYFMVNGVLQDPEETPKFTVWDNTVSPEVRVGEPRRLMTKVKVGEWYARFQIPDNAAYGQYRVAVDFVTRTDLNELVEQSVDIEFTVVSSQPQTYTNRQQELIDRLRIMIRDNWPDAYYRFAPPSSQKIIRGFTEKTGYLWQDNELLEFLKLGDMVLKSSWAGQNYSIFKDSNFPGEYLALLVAASSACAAEAIRWVSEEFQYDLNGVSLSIDRSSKFESLANGFWDRANAYLTDILNPSIKIVRSVKALRSVSRGYALGPNVQGSPIFSYIQRMAKGV